MICEARLPGCEGMAVHTHHRKMRSQGGKDTPANLLRVCLSCHARIHHYPAKSYELGLLVHSWDDPEKVPVGEAA